MAESFINLVRADTVRSIDAMYAEQNELVRLGIVARAGDALGLVQTEVADVTERIFKEISSVSVRGRRFVDRLWEVRYNNGRGHIAPTVKDATFLERYKRAQNIRDGAALACISEGFGVSIFERDDRAGYEGNICTVGKLPGLRVSWL